jgi:hypothetical protein
MIVKRRNKEILEEKEFGIPSDIFYSGFKKTYKKWFGKLRKELAESVFGLVDFIRKEISTIEIEVKDNSLKPINNDVFERLLDYVKSLDNIKIIRSNAENKFDASHNIIYIKDDADIISLAHEIGHAITANFSIDEEIRDIASKNNTFARDKFKRLGSNLTSNLVSKSLKMTPPERLDLIKKGQLYNNISNKDAFNQLKEGGVITDIVIIEETNASNIAIELLKKFGATEEELSIARKRYDLALNTYKLKSDKISTILFTNLINIKSRRTKIW